MACVSNKSNNNTEHYYWMAKMRANCSSFASSSLLVIMMFFGAMFFVSNKKKIEIYHIFFFNILRISIRMSSLFFPLLRLAKWSKIHKRNNKSYVEAAAATGNDISIKLKSINSRDSYPMSCIMYTRLGHIIWMVRWRWHGKVWWTQKLNTETRQAQQCRIHGSLFIII